MTVLQTLRHPRARRVGLLVIAALAVGAAVVVPGHHSSPPSDHAGGITAGPSRNDEAGRAFFDRYVTADGRVVRHDQGGDTVSEGQAYALLLAVGAHDEDRFNSVWDWTRHNLQRPDGLFSWRWRDGAVADRQPAADADVDAARALALAAGEFDRPDLRAEASRIAGAVLDQEVVTAGGRSALAAGPWAVAGRTVNASYWSPCAAADLARVTGDARWQTLADDAVALVDAATDGGTRLPSDWSRLDDSGALQPISAPGGSGPGPVYSFDAARVALRLAEPCSADGGADDAGRDLAAGLWPLLHALPDDASREAYHLDGTPAVGPDARHPAGLIGAAAAAAAAGDGQSVARLLDAAGALEQQRPTYYGAALIALARTSFPNKERAAERSFAPGALQLIASAEPPPTSSTTNPTSPPSTATTTTSPLTTTSTAPTTTTTRPTPTTTPTGHPTTPPPTAAPTRTDPAPTGPAATTRAPRPTGSTTTGSDGSSTTPAAPEASADPSAGPAAGPLRPGILTRPSTATAVPPPDQGTPPSSDQPGGSEAESDDAMPARTGVLLAGAGLTALLGTRLGRRSL